MNTMNTVNGFNSDSIEELANLGSGWDFGEGDSIQQDVIDRAIKIAGIAANFGFNYEALPLTDGGIKLIFSEGDSFLDVNIENDLSINITKENGFGFNYDRLYSRHNLTTEDVVIEFGFRSIIA